jgi:tetratricopeptide (TPR) repeat protein
MGKSLWIPIFIILLPLGLSHAYDMQAPAQQYRTANKLFATARYKEAIALYETLLTNPPKQVPISDIYTRIGDSYFRLGEYKDALPAYRFAIRSQKTSEQPATQYWIAFCCLLMGNDADAVTEFLKIPERYPTSGMWVGTAYYWAGRASERRGKTEEAAGYYKKAGGNGRSNQGRFALNRAAAVQGK